MKNLLSFSEFVNESKLNEASFNVRDVDGGSMADLLDQYQGSDPEETGIFIDAMTDTYEKIAHALGGNINNVHVGDAENTHYEFYEFLMRCSLGKVAFKSGANVHEVKDIKSFTSACGWREGDTQIHIMEIPGVAKYACWLDGDEFANFDFAAYKKSDLPKIAAWVKDNWTDKW